jgi:hypothetical protein
MVGECPQNTKEKKWIDAFMIGKGQELRDIPQM